MIDNSYQYFNLAIYPPGGPAPGGPPENPMPPAPGGPPEQPPSPPAPGGPPVN